MQYNEPFNGVVGIGTGIDLRPGEGGGDGGESEEEGLGVHG